METGLVRYDAMCQAIAECHNVDEAKEIRNKTRALEVYAKLAKNKEAEIKAAEIRVRAERRMGQLLAEALDHGVNGRPRKISVQPPDTYSTTLPRLKDLGITRNESSQWQELAEIPEAEFEDRMRRCNAIPSTEGIINGHRFKTIPKVDQISGEALMLSRWFCEFEEYGFGQQDVSGLLSEMTEHMRDDILRIAPKMLQWLKTSGLVK